MLAGQATRRRRLPSVSLLRRLSQTAIMRGRNSWTYGNYDGRKSWTYEDSIGATESSSEPAIPAIQTDSFQRAPTQPRPGVDPSDRSQTGGEGFALPPRLVAIQKRGNPYFNNPRRPRLDSLACVPRPRRARPPTNHCCLQRRRDPRRCPSASARRREEVRQDGLFLAPWR